MFRSFVLRKGIKLIFLLSKIYYYYLRNVSSFVEFTIVQYEKKKSWVVGNNNNTLLLQLGWYEYF